MCEASPQCNSLFYIQHSFVSYLERVKRDRWATRNSLLLFFLTFKFPSYLKLYTCGQNFNISFVALLLPWKIPGALSAGYFIDP